MIFEPLEILEKWAALVPAPQLTIIRYFRALGVPAGWKPLVIPSEPVADSISASVCTYDNKTISALEILSNLHNDLRFYRKRSYKKTPQNANARGASDRILSHFSHGSLTSDHCISDKIVDFDVRALIENAFSAGIISPDMAFGHSSTLLQHIYALCLLATARAVKALPYFTHLETVEQ